MKVKVLALLSQHPQLKVQCEAMDQKYANLKERLTFLEKQLRDAEKEYKDQESSCMASIGVYLREKGVFTEDIDNKDQWLRYSTEGNYVELCTREESDRVPNFITKIFGV